MEKSKETFLGYKSVYHKIYNKTYLQPFYEGCKNCNCLNGFCVINNNELVNKFRSNLKNGNYVIMDNNVDFIFDNGRFLNPLTNKEIDIYLVDLNVGGRVFKDIKEMENEKNGIIPNKKTYIYLNGNFKTYKDFGFYMPTGFIKK